jgi:hypothetical protein
MCLELPFLAKLDIGFDIQKIISEKNHPTSLLKSPHIEVSLLVTQD